MEQTARFAYGTAERCEASPSFEALAAEWRVWGYRLALKITGCPDAAEDALQDALIRAFRHGRNLREPVAASAWFRRIVVRCAMDQAAVPQLLGVEGSEPATRGAEIEETLQVRRTLGRLRSDQRALLALAIGEGLSYEEIGQALGIGAGTVASRLHAAKEAFRQKWGGDR